MLNFFNCVDAAYFDRSYSLRSTIFARRKKINNETLGRKGSSSLRANRAVVNRSRQIRERCLQRARSREEIEARTER